MAKKFRMPRKIKDPVPKNVQEMLDLEIHEGFFIPEKSCSEVWYRIRDTLNYLKREGLPDREYGTLRERRVLVNDSWVSSNHAGVLGTTIYRKK